MSSEKDATEWIVQCLTQFYDNVEPRYNAITEVACNAVKSNGRSAYETMLRTGEDKPNYIHAVGEAVSEYLADDAREELASVDEDFADTLFSMLDLHSGETKYQLGEHYLPESADDVDWPDEDEEI